MTTNYGKPLITIEGKDCELCCGKSYIIVRFNDTISKPKCLDCFETGKSPTKLIFDAEDFRCEAAMENPPENWKCVEGDKCTGYLLPKKGELICGNCCHQNHFLKDCPLCECEKYKPFHLSSDAVLKSVGEMPDYFNSKLKLLNAPNKKIVIAEGYYE